MAKKSFSNINPAMQFVSGLENNDNEIVFLDIKRLKPNPNNPFPISDVDDLVGSIKINGILHNLIVQEDGDDYLIISGERRYTATNKILDEDLMFNEFQHLNQVPCKIISADANRTLTEFQLYEANFQVRSFNSMTIEERNKIINGYLDLIARGREEKLEVNGRIIQGKTRDILADMLGVSARTAQKYINEANEATTEDDEGGKVATPKEKKVKTSSDELRSIFKKLEKMAFEGTAEEQEVIDEITEFLQTI